MVKDHGQSILIPSPDYNSPMLLATVAIPLDGLKFLLLLVVGGGLLALGRWSSRLGGTKGTDSPANLPTPDPQELLPSRGSGSRLWPPSAEEVAASLPFDPSLGRIRIRKLFFDKTDVSPGPDDPEVFADDLHIELYDPDSGHAWWQSYFVATPLGLSKILREKHWRYLHAPDILVLPRYDLEEIRRAVVSRIVAENELFKGKDQAGEESL
jgi:hypothetical protein